MSSAIAEAGIEIFSTALEVWVQVTDQSGATTMECANTENELRFTSLEQRGNRKLRQNIGRCQSENV